VKKSGAISLHYTVRANLVRWSDSDVVIDRKKS